MKLLTFATLSLILTIVSSTKCTNSELKCIELCCGKTQFYWYKTCVDFPAHAKASWLAVLDDKTTISETVEFVEYGKCHPSDDLIANCYSPYYDAELKQFGISMATNVPCDRLKVPTVSYGRIIRIVFFGALSISLPIMVVYTCRKDSNAKFTFKLASWYLVSMAVSLLTAATGPLGHYLPMDFKDIYEIFGVIGEFFFISTCLWLNAIGFQVWWEYKKRNEQDNSRNYQRRFIFYSIYVWGTAAIFTSLSYLIKEEQWGFINTDWLDMPIPLFNVVTFLILSVNICLTRCRVINLTTETHFKRELASVILRLGLMMGFPRMLIIILDVILNIVNFYLMTFFFCLEPFVIFMVLLWKPNNWCNFNLLCSCCRNSQEIPNAVEVVYVHTNED